jgi:hypothetical protein
LSVVSGMFCDGVGIHHVLGDEEGWTVQWVRQANGTVWTIHQPILNFSFSQTYDLRTQVQDLEAARRSRSLNSAAIHHPSNTRHPKVCVRVNMTSGDLSVAMHVTSGHRVLRPLIFNYPLNA